MSSFANKQAKRIIEQFRELPEQHQQAILDHIKYSGAVQAAKEVAKTRTVHFGDIYADIEERQQHFNKFEGIMTGLKYFDDATMGLRAGELIVIAAPSNYGKTMVALNMGVSAAVTSNKKTLIISMEMPAVEVGQRAYNMTDDHEALMENLIIQTELRVNTKHIMVMIERHKPDLLILDHIQFLANQEQGSEYERITTAVANLKNVAMTKMIPVIAISHVAKTRSGAEGQATASDLKGSSSIEQDADVGIMINRMAGEEVGNNIVLTLFKHRTKRPAVFHKDCYLQFDGVRIANRGAYEVHTDPEPLPPRQAVKRSIGGW